MRTFQSLLYLEVITEGIDDLLDLLGQFSGWGKDKALSLLQTKVNSLHEGDGKCCCLSSSRLGLSNDIKSLYTGDNGARLDSRGSLKTGERWSVS